MRIVIPLFPGFTALDAVGPYEVLRFLPDADVVFAAAEAGPVRDHAGWLTLVAGSTFDDIAAADVVVVPGGPGARAHLADDTLLGWIRRVHETATWTTSVCTGSLLLGAAGLLDGLEATTHWSAVETLESFGATYTAPRRRPAADRHGRRCVRRHRHGARAGRTDRRSDLRRGDPARDRV